MKATFKLIFGLLVACELGLELNAYAKPVLVTRANISQFKQLAKKEPFFCFKSKSLGILNRLALKINAEWERGDTKTLTAKKRAEETKLQKALGAKKRDPRAIAKSQKLIAAQTKLITKSQFYGSQCPLQSTTQEFIGEAGSLTPYKETLSDSEIRHFLNKVAFGGNEEIFLLAKTQGLTALVDTLLEGITNKQVNSDAMFWADRQLVVDDETGEKLWHTYSLQVFAMYKALFSDNPFQIRMALLFWHPHFAINLSKVGLGFNAEEHLALKEYWGRLEKNSVGNFATLAQEMVSDPAMMRWLNNEDNAVGASNQNFAREFLELFTLGPLDPFTLLPNYSQESIIAATAFFSGFAENYTSGKRKIVFDTSLKDPAAYPVFAGVSGAQANQSFTASGFARQILSKHPGAPRFLTERLFAQLVYPDVEESVVKSLASDLLQANYELKPILKTMLRSSSMFSKKARKRCVSNPIDQVVHLARKIIRTPLSQRSDKIEAGDWLLWLLSDIGTRTGQSIFEPPSVFAWPSACGLNRNGKKHFGEGFITEQNALGRSQLAVDLTNYGIANEVDFKSFLPSFSMTPRELVIFIAASFYDITPSESAIAILEIFLLTELTVKASEPLKYNLSDSDYVKRKLPALIVLLGESTQANQL